MAYIVDNFADYGTYHLSNDGSCPWYEFASKILKDKSIKVAPITSEEYPQKAYRPKHTIIDLSKIKATGFVIPTWEEGLKKYMEVT